MKILLFCHLGQIREYAEYINALKKHASVQSLFLTMGQEEFELGQQVVHQIIVALGLINIVGTPDNQNLGVSAIVEGAFGP